MQNLLRCVYHRVCIYLRHFDHSNQIVFLRLHLASLVGNGAIVRHRKVYTKTAKALQHWMVTYEHMIVIIITITVIIIVVIIYY